MKEEILLNFRNWIEQGCDERGWSFRELSKRAGFSQSYISNISSGARGLSWDVVAEVSKAFEVSPIEGFRIVGFLPPSKNRSEKLLDIVDNLTDDQIEDVIMFARWRRAQHKFYL